MMTVEELIEALSHFKDKEVLVENSEEQLLNIDLVYLGNDNTVRLVIED